MRTREAPLSAAAVPPPWKREQVKSRRSLGHGEGGGMAAALKGASRIFKEHDGQGYATFD